MGVAALVFVGGVEDADPEAEPSASGRARLVPVGDDGGTRPREQPTCVLLVEDDPSMRLLCKVNLESEGFRVVAAGGGEEGLALAASEHPDVALLDVMLPDLGGFDVAARLRIPVVFLSARTSELDLERGRRAGAIDYVTKPFDPTALPSRLREDLEALDRSGDAGHVWRMRFGAPDEQGG